MAADDPSDLGDLEFQLTRTNADGVVIVGVRGDVDVSTSPRLRDELHGAIGSGASRVVVDMAGMDFIDSAGLGVLIGSLKRAREQGVELVLSNLQTSPRKVIAITGLDDVFTLDDSV